MRRLWYKIKLTTMYKLLYPTSILILFFGTQISYAQTSPPDFYLSFDNSFEETLMLNNLATDNNEEAIVNERIKVSNNNETIAYSTFEVEITNRFGQKVNGIVDETQSLAYTEIDIK